MNISKYLKVLFINFAFISIGFFTCELLFRSLQIYKSCSIKNCNWKILNINTLKKNEKKNSIYITNNKLGYLPIPNLKTIKYDNKQFTNTSDGLRKSSYSKSEGIRILTVGDSFTWGDQVSDSETWQSCLNEKFQSLTFP